jgi:hypothetical protein
MEAKGKFHKQPPKSNSAERAGTLLNLIVASNSFRSSHMAARRPSVCRPDSRKIMVAVSIAWTRSSTHANQIRRR